MRLRAMRRRVKRPSSRRNRRTPDAEHTAAHHSVPRAGFAISSELPRLYRDLAWLWPILSPPDHYVDEAATLRATFRQLKGRARTRTPKQRPRLLDLGAGGGHLLAHLARDFECTAADLSPAMLENCARL